MFMRCIGFKITKNYGIEFAWLYKVRDFKDGISFIDFDINLDLYKADHTPAFKIQLMILNFNIFEFNWYYLHHRDEE